MRKAKSPLEYRFKLLLYSVHEERISPLPHMASANDGASSMPLSMLNRCTAKSGRWYLKLVHAELEEYSYDWNGKQIRTTKLRVCFVSMNEREYCVSIKETEKPETKHSCRARSSLQPRLLSLRKSRSISTRRLSLHWTCEIPGSRLCLRGLS